MQQEAERRGYRFDAGKISHHAGTGKISVTRGQLEYELAHLKAKLRLRDAAAYRHIEMVGQPDDVHPLFQRVAGEIEDWEVVAADGR